MTWGLRWLPAWTRALFARYFIGSFPITERWKDISGRRKYATAAKTPAEACALRIMRILVHGCHGEEGKEYMEKATKALDTLRSLGSRER